MRLLLALDTVAVVALFAFAPRFSTDWIVGMTMMVSAISFVLSIVAIIVSLGFRLACKAAARAPEPSVAEQGLDSVRDPFSPAAATATFSAAVGVIFFAIGMIAMCYSLIAVIVPGLGR
jgi:hypothetical protein